jgi:hypothetical protein
VDRFTQSLYTILTQIHTLQINSLKALTKTFSQKNILGYFGSPSLKPSSAPASAPISPSASPEPNLASALTVPPDLASDSSGTASPAPSLHHGVFLSGLLRSGTHGSGSDPPQPVSIDITKVYLDGDSYEHHDSDGQNASKNLQEYYFVVYKVGVSRSCSGVRGIETHSYPSQAYISNFMVFPCTGFQ